MKISYKKLWILLVCKNMNKTQLRVAANISTNSLAKLSKDEPVTLDVLMKVCETLKCNIGDICEFI